MISFYRDVGRRSRLMSVCLLLVSLFVSVLVTSQPLAGASSFVGGVSGVVSGRSTATAATSSGLFLNKSNNTDSPSIAIDPAGGYHFAYSAYGPDVNGKEPAYYAYCASNCASAASWTITTVSDGVSKVSKVQLALDSAGRPRMLLYGEDPSFNHQWQYAACDTGCSSGANWTVVTLTPVSYIDISIFDYSPHNFKLDPQGRPRFVYYDDALSNNGTFYAFCDANCTMLANWFQLRISTDILHQPELAFSASGQPRIAADIFANPGPSTGILNYLECNTSCTSDPANWSQTPLYERGGGNASWVLRLDASDRPHMLFYQGVPDSGPGDRLYYVWCDTSCTNAANWGRSSVGLAQTEGTNPDLVLDSQNHLRIAYQKGADGLGYGRCDTNCESPSANWQHQLAESSSVLDVDWPLPPPANCSSAYWVGGYRPSLALDASGNPRIGYDALHLHGTGCTAGEDFRAVRFIVPSGGLSVYLPLIMR
jgi:hypothetical protein